MNDEKETIVVHNGSQRAIRTSQGILPIGGSLAVSPEEAKSLMGYAGIRDASTLVPQTAHTIDNLKKRIDYLEEENKNLQRQIAQLTPNVKETAESPAAESPAPESTPEDEDVVAPKHQKGKGRR